MASESGRYRILDLFADDPSSPEAGTNLSWPNQSRFPLNLPGSPVKNVIIADLRSGEEALIVTGFASLDRLIDLIAETPGNSTIRVLLGSEPFESKRDQFRLTRQTFQIEIQEYWLNRGISLLLSAKLLRCIEYLRDGRVDVRHGGDNGKRLHAKIYVGAKAATVGSSNFTKQGLAGQWEANARFCATTEKKRYQELKSIAENYWHSGVPFTDELIVLLEQLLRSVSWVEALARSCAELLEGDWAQAVISNTYLPGAGELWPAQRQGIAQALYILSRQGSVLVADATGSGKTRMGANLIRAIADQVTTSGRLRKGNALMVCPPPVQANWEEEATYAGAALQVFSHGVLSHTQSEKHERTVEAVRRSQILCLDEGHNFLNTNSNRTRNLLLNMADHVLLFTATPINKSAKDLLRIANMLGADNLEPSVRDAFEKMLSGPTMQRTLSDEEISILRAEIQKFTVRRTKRNFNQLIDRDPNAYLDRAGKPCRFPRHDPKVYTLGESARDRDIATQIRQLSSKLNACLYFTGPIELPDIWRVKNLSEESYLDNRLRTAKAMASYHIMASLRSSRLALAEHIGGTERAVKDFELENFKKSTDSGNMLSRLKRIRSAIPKNRLSIALPDWLSEPDAHAAACDSDLATYRQIYQLALELSDGRERAKAAHLLELMKQHALVLAFDRSPITLATIKWHILEQDSNQKVVIATGDAGSERQKVLEFFKWGSEVKDLIGLCSDSLAEGVNLQQASCLVHLDVPSVVRIAEQRAGRVDRMDSPHEVIETWWPQDADEFALSSDTRFIERYETVDQLLGSNLPLPDSMLSAPAKPIEVRQIIEEYEQSSDKEEWDGIRDAFEPVRRLIDGSEALVDANTYEAYRKVTARVLSRVSIVKASKPWAFFSVAGGAFRAPHWVLFKGTTGHPMTELGPICDALRDRLGGDIENLPITQKSAGQLNGFVARLSQVEKTLLPRKLQVALEEMERVIENFQKKASEDQNQLAVDYFGEIIRMLRQPDPERQPNWEEVATRWLDIIRPTWYEKLKNSKGKLLLLKDIRRELYDNYNVLGPRIIESFSQFPILPSPDERIAACIIGVA